MASAVFLSVKRRIESTIDWYWVSRKFDSHSCVKWVSLRAEATPLIKWRFCAKKVRRIESVCYRWISSDFVYVSRARTSAEFRPFSWNWNRLARIQCQQHQPPPSFSICIPITMLHACFTQCLSTSASRSILLMRACCTRVQVVNILTLGTFNRQTLKISANARCSFNSFCRLQQYCIVGLPRALRLWSLVVDTRLI